LSKVLLFSFFNLGFNFLLLVLGSDLVPGFGLTAGLGLCFVLLESVSDLVLGFGLAAGLVLQPGLHFSFVVVQIAVAAVAFAEH
jgi:hypothetical protein